MAPEQQRRLEELVGAHLDGTLSGEQTAELAALLAADGEARTLFARSLAMDTVLPRVAPAQRPVLRLRPRRWSAYAAAALLVLGLGAWLRHDRADGPTLPPGSSAIVLRDGEVLKASEAGPLRSADRIRADRGVVVISWPDEATQAILAAGSGLELVDAGPGKELLLEEGTVTVDAAPQNGARHLHVRTAQLSVAVVGTRFHVNETAGVSTVAVEHGTVMVDSGDGAHAVTGGQIAVSSATGAAGTAPGISGMPPKPAGSPLAISTPGPSAPALPGARLDAAAWRAVNGVGWTGTLRAAGIAAVIDTTTAERIQTPQRAAGYARVLPDLRITADLSLAKPATVAIFLVCRRSDGRDWIANYRLETTLPAGRHQRSWTMADLGVEKGAAVSAAQGALIGSVVVCAWHQPVGLVVHTVAVGNAGAPALRP